MRLARWHYELVLSSFVFLAAGTSTGQQPATPELRGLMQPSGGVGPFDLLRIPAVQRELELVGDQFAALEKLLNGGQTQLRSTFESLRELQDLPEAERDARRLEILREIQNRPRELSLRVQEILVPHQSQRLSELTLQFRLEREGLPALAAPEVCEPLGLSADQRLTLQKLAHEKTRELNEQIETLRAQADRQVLRAVLTPAQLAKFDQLHGAPFPSKASSAKSP